MWSLQRPFEGKEYEELKTNIVNKPVDLIPDIYSKDLQELVTQMLSKDIEKRPTTREVTQSDKFLKNCHKLKIMPPLDFKKAIDSTDNSEQLNTPHIIIPEKLNYTPNVAEYKDETLTPYANRISMQFDERSSLSRLLTPVRKLVQKRKNLNFFTFSKKNLSNKSKSKHFHLLIR